MMLRSLCRAGALALALFSTSAMAFDVTGDDHGGLIGPYAARVAMAQAHGEAVRVGPVACESSCTLYLAARNGCVSPGAMFGFHAPWLGGPTGGVRDPRLTALFARHYKPALRRLFMAHVAHTRGMAPGPMMRLSGLQLASLGYRLCG